VLTQLLLESRGEGGRRWGRAVSALKNIFRHGVSDVAVNLLVVMDSFGSRAGGWGGWSELPNLLRSFVLPVGSAIVVSSG
jgi:hypothetical protein